MAGPADESIIFVGHGDDNGNVCVWDLSTGKCLYVFKDHTQATKLLAVLDDKLISSSSDGTTNVRNWRTGLMVAYL